MPNRGQFQPKTPTTNAPDYLAVMRNAPRDPFAAALLIARQYRPALTRQQRSTDGQRFKRAVDQYLDEIAH